MVPLFAQEATQEEEERKEEWFEDKPFVITRVVKPAEEVPPIEKKKPKRWRLFGAIGWAYDSNVPLATNKKEFRRTVGTESIDTNANRFHIETGLGLTLYRGSKYQVETTYEWSHNLHDDSLNEFNFQNHAVGIEGIRRLTLWNRPSKVALGYEFNHGIRGGRSFVSSHSWYLEWTGEWKKNFPLTVYEYLEAKDFRREGFRASDTSRDGFYHRTGFFQQYLFEVFDRKSEVNFGYEFGFQATHGNRFDRFDNGIRTGFETRLIEKIRFETNFYFQQRNHYHWPGSPNRHDLHYKYEFILSRRFGSHLKGEAFYRRTDVNNLNDGVLGVFNYNRNIYGVELKFYY
jgi:hypothetical protein